MNSEKAIDLEGTIMAVLPGTMFRVALANDHLVLANRKVDPGEDEVRPEGLAQTLDLECR